MSAAHTPSALRQRRHRERRRFARTWLAGDLSLEAFSTLVRAGLVDPDEADPAVIAWAVDQALRKE